ncbi:hypothetical protein T09_14463 [Trichinella sp. T9]|nr:hypothetical protein T09_14463 [Trichinella sp. T9]
MKSIFPGWSTSVPLFTYWSLTTLFYWTIKSLSYSFIGPSSLCLIANNNSKNSQQRSSTDFPPDI